MVFHGNEMITMDPRWGELAKLLGFERYSAIIGYVENPVSQTSITRVHRLEADKNEWRGGIFLKKIIADRWYRYFLREAKVYLEAKNYRRMDEIGIPVPKVLAIGERRFLGGLIDAFLLTTGVEDAMTLEEYAERYWNKVEHRDVPGRRKERRGIPAPEEMARGEVHSAGVEDGGRVAAEMEEIFEQLAGIVRKMHDANFFHIDLQWRNILVQRRPEGVKLFLIDCPRGGRRWFWLRRRNGIMHDLAGLDKLASLYFTPRTRLNWYKKYVGGRGFDRQDRAMLWRVRWEIEHRRQRRDGR